ncbi:hypothetical protein Aazo_3961 ['Nostoc azollae' 0708]|jgi:hypothetical protein|uniref:Uncharacterized protein n=1 Tax=Nostoc azollae (strain 0708) TaxID=551115 RepID=D7E594_NOSA0|nr:hypothetical protein Aazo_3961 ['Nostoc azollae' 0708]
MLCPYFVDIKIYLQRFLILRKDAKSAINREKLSVVKINENCFNPT